MTFFWRRAGKGDGGRHAPMPVVVGSPRSGTTLLRFMLDSHPELAIPPETGFLKLAPSLRGAGDRLRERFLRAIVNFPAEAPAWPDFEIPEETFRAALAQVEPFNAADGFRAFYRLYAARFRKTRYGDKTPFYCTELKTIRRILPEARFVHIIRDGRDAAMSLRRMWFSPGYEIETQAAYWRANILAARRAGANRADYLEVRYEDLILDPRAVLRRVCSFVALDYDEAMLDYHTRTPERLKEHKGRTRADGTVLSSREQRLEQQRRTTEPPDPARVYAWKTAMPADERERFRRVAGDLLKELGYEL